MPDEQQGSFLCVAAGVGSWYGSCRGGGGLANHLAGWGYVPLEVISSQRDNGNGNSKMKFQDESIYLFCGQ